VKPIVFVVVTVQSLSLPGDSWFGADKAKHFFLGTFIQSAAFSGLRAGGIQKEAALGAATAVTVGAAFTKEFRDRGGKGTASLKDAAWTLAGAAAISPVLLRAK
jgi:putative lipoprotein